MRNAFYILTALVWINLGPLPAQADPLIKSAPEVAQNMHQGQMVLLDIRSAGEWEETGLAKGAWPVSMHAPDFRLKLEKILLLHKPEEIAIICATGGRTGYISKILEQNGIIGVTDLSEGMFGNENGPGWIAHGLPVITLNEAQANFDAKFASK